MNNIIENNYQSAQPAIGMGATELLYSDRHAYTVIAVAASGKRATIQQDTSIRSDQNGMSDSQSYRYEANPDGALKEIKLYRDGHWHIYTPGYGKGSVVMLGGRQEYYDYSF